MCAFLGWIGWINPQHIYLLIMKLSSFSELGSAYPGWIGWISTRLFYDFREIEISASMCARFLVEFVELILNKYIYSLWIGWINPQHIYLLWEG